MNVMKSILFSLLFSITFFQAYAQSDIKTTVAKMNQCISAFSADNAQPISFFGVSGILEQKQDALIQRINLTDIQRIKIEPSQAGFGVTFSCKENQACVNLLKNDMNSSTMSSTTFFFANAAAANTFGSAGHMLANSVKSKDAELELILYKTEKGETPLLPSNTPAKSTTSEQPKEPIANTIPKNTPKEKTIKELQEEEDTEVTEKPKKSSKTTKKPKSDDDDIEQEEPEDKPIKKSKKQQPTEDEEEPEEKTNKKTKKQQDSEVDDPQPSNEKSASNDFCAQLLQVVNAGLKTKYKEIEGKETNAEKKINESKLKLKGSRKNYISWFNNERAFISELKSLADNDYAIDAFEKLQGELDECLADGWDDNDHSNDAVYESAKFEVKDVEYTNNKIPNSPSIRIAIAPEGTKFVLFVRIK